MATFGPGSLEMQKALLRVGRPEGIGEPTTCEYEDPGGSGNVFQETTTGLAIIA